MNPRTVDGLLTFSSQTLTIPKHIGPQVVHPTVPQISIPRLLRVGLSHPLARKHTSDEHGRICRHTRANDMCVCTYIVD